MAARLVIFSEPGKRPQQIPRGPEQYHGNRSKAGGRLGRQILRYSFRICDLRGSPMRPMNRQACNLHLYNTCRGCMSPGEAVHRMRSSQAQSTPFHPQKISPASPNLSWRARGSNFRERVVCKEAGERRLLRASRICRHERGSCNEFWRPMCSNRERKNTPQGKPRRRRGIASSGQPEAALLVAGRPFMLASDKANED